MAVHGDITEITYSHPTLGSGTFFPKANEGNSFDAGGLRNSDDASMITSSGDMIIQKNMVRGSFEVLIENDMNIREDQLTLVALAESPVPTNWTFSVINGTVWAGTGVVVSDIVADVNAGTMPLKVAGRFVKQ